MDTRMVALALVAASGAVPALAQDSVSRNANGGNGLPGDVPSAWSTTGVRSAYVVDLTPITTSRGTPFGVAPLLKAGRANTSRFNALNISGTLGQALATGVAYPSPSYTRWTQAGGGINTFENDASLNTPVSPTGPASVFGVAMLDVDEVVSGTSNVVTNHVPAAQVAFDPAEPGRLFVYRVNAASNSSGLTQPDRSQLGLGSVDAEGNVCIRADGYGVAATGTTPLQGDNYFRIRLPARGTSVDVIDNSGGTQPAANDWLLVQSGVTTAVPAAIPATLAGRSVLVGADFVGQLRAETTAGALTSTGAHRPGTLDHRGSAGVSAKVLFPGSVATGAVLTRASGGGGRTDSISVFGMGASGAVTGARTVTTPEAISDQCDAFAWPFASGSIRGYDSQMTFRGGVGPVAVSKDASGLALAAATLYSGSTPNPATPQNAIAVARFDATQPNGAVLWTLAAWVDADAMTGKQITGDFGQDGTPGTGDTGEGDGEVNAMDAPIGRLAGVNESSLGLSGPSLSAPAFDSAGNVYFIASALFNRAVGQQIVQEYGVGLFRAVYDPSSMCYTLDLVLRTGQVVTGANSARDYRIEAVSLSDADSVSSASMASAGVTQQAWNNVASEGLPPESPVTLGGLVATARVVYDVNQDGQFIDPTGVGGDPASTDEAYNVLLYVGNLLQPPAACDPDLNQDGNVDQDDIAYLINVIGGGANPSGIDPDFNVDGNADQDDVSALINVVAGGLCP